MFSKPLPASLCLLLALAPFATAATTSSSSRSTTSSRSSVSANTSTSRGSGSAASSTGARQYRSNTLLEDALIQVDAETRSIVVVGDEKTQQAVAQVIQNLDRSRPQVLIKVVFIQVTLDKDLDVGLEGGYTFSPGHSGTAGTLFGLANDLASTTTANKGMFATINSGNWSATLRALSSRGKTKVLSRPSIMARNNQEAVIVVGQQYPMVTNSEITEAGNTINTITYKDVGIILKVTPFITANHSVEMIVAPEISEISDSSVTISSEVTASIINKRSAETVVVTPNGVTTVIGGLMQTEHTSTKQKVPILGDIPVLGWPFQRTVKSDQKTELLIFLTPYIVDDNTNSIQALTQNEANRADLTRETLTPEEVRNNLDTLRLMPQVEPPLPTVTTVTTVEKRPVTAQPKAAASPAVSKVAPKPTATPKPSATPVKKGKAAPTASPTPALQTK